MTTPLLRAAILAVLSAGAATAQRPEAQPPDAFGRVVGVAKDGTSVTLEQPPKERGGEPGKLEVKIGPKTEATYHGVALNGAKPAEGYQARVNLDGAKTTATSIVFMAGDGGRGGSGLTGLVRGTAKDGKGVTLETRARGRGDDAKTVDIAFDSKTVILFSGVEKDGAKITDGQVAMVQLMDGTKNNTAGVVTFSPTDGRGMRREKRPELLGKLISGDDKSLTLEVSAGRGEQPEKQSIKLGGKSEVRYFNVVAGAAKPAEGMLVQVWLEDGSKDTAAAVMLMAVPPQRWATVQGRVASVSADGSTITVEEPPTRRDEEAKRTTIKVSKETKLSFSNVGPNEAKPTEGYRAIVRLQDDSKDAAAEIQFFKPGAEGRR